MEPCPYCGATDRLHAVLCPTWSRLTPPPDPTAPRSVAELLNDFRPAMERPEDGTPTWSNADVMTILDTLTHERAKVLREAAEALRLYSQEHAVELDRSARAALFMAGKTILELERVPAVT